MKMRMLCAAACLCIPALVWAQAGPKTPQALAQLQADATGLTPEQVVDDFHRRLAEGWKEGAEAHLDPALLLFEQGYIEGSRQSYGGGQMYSDMVFAAATQRRLLHRRSGIEGGAAWVLSQVRTRGQVSGQRVDRSCARERLRGTCEWPIIVLLPGLDAIFNVNP